jgi:hypothetical protein
MSTYVYSSVVGNVGTWNTTTFQKTGNSGVDELPKEMHEMKIRDDKSDNVDDKVNGCSF